MENSTPRGPKFLDFFKWADPSQIRFAFFKVCTSPTYIPQSMLIAAIKACLLPPYESMLFKDPLRHMGLTKGGLDDPGQRLVPSAVSSKSKNDPASAAENNPI